MEAKIKPQDFVTVAGAPKYEINRLGVVRNKQTGQIKKTSLSSKGYPILQLYIDGVAVNKSIHRLVATTFIPNPENKPFVNHLDRNRQNHHVSNLEWCTPLENARHSVENGGRAHYIVDNRGTKNPNARFSVEDVRNMRRLYNSKELSQGKLAIMYNTTQSVIHKIVTYKNWAHVA